jgi:hypothetical protein
MAEYRSSLVGDRDNPVQFARIERVIVQVEHPPQQLIAHDQLQTVDKPLILLGMTHCMGVRPPGVRGRPPGVRLLGPE